MRNLKSISAGLLMLMGCMTVSAQNSVADEEAQQLGYRPQPYGFVQVQGGIGTTFTDVPNHKIIKPTFSLAVGGMFSNAVGARLHVNGFKSQGGFGTMSKYYPGETAWVESEGWKLIDGNVKKYSYNYINTNLDLMLNLVNLFTKKNNNFFNVYLIGGVGLNYAWNNSEFEDLTRAYSVGNDISNAWGTNETPRHSLLGHNLRAGLLLDLNVAKHWSIGAEVDMNSLDDRFNSKYNNADDWMLTAQLSVTYKFGFKKAKKPVTPVTTTSNYESNDNDAAVAAAAVVPVTADDGKAKDVVKPAEPLKESVFYAIRETESASDREAILEKVANWCKKYPKKTIEVRGYADKGTGNPTVNQKYAEERAQKVSRDLQSKGVAASRIKVTAYGDSVQPYTENDQNRCVIIIGE